MFEIAGGILIAVAVLVALPYILAGAYWAVAIAIGLAIVGGIWLMLEAAVGQQWASVICVEGIMIFCGWVDANRNGGAHFKKMLRYAIALPIFAAGTCAVIVVGFAGIMALATLGAAIIFPLGWEFGEIGTAIGVIVCAVAYIFCFTKFAKWQERRKTAPKEALNPA